MRRSRGQDRQDTQKMGCMSVARLSRCVPRPSPMNAADWTVAQGSDAISSHRLGQSGRLVRDNRHIRFTIVLGEGVSVSRAGCQEDHDGPRLQRHILRGDEGLALGEGGYVAF